MRRGQKRGKAVIGLSDLNNSVKIDSSPKKDASTEKPRKPKIKCSKTEFQGKLSHASPNARITRYYHSQNNINSQLPTASTISLRSTVNRRPNSSAASNEIDDSPLTQEDCKLKTEKQDSPERALLESFEKLPFESSKKDISVSSSNTPNRPTFLTHKKSVKSKRKLQYQASKPLLPPLGESKKCNNNHKLTEYFPVRRSARRTKKVVLEEKQRHLEEAVVSKSEDGLEIRMFPGKGRGIVTTRSFNRGEFVVEYAGELITYEEAKKREQVYANDQNTGCYMYYFKHNNGRYCVDATPESDRLGRLVNHSRFGNLMTKTVVVDNQPHLVLIAKDDIQSGDEITYDYGDRSKESLYYHPWLAS
ncbi:histone-lysine N-methyltransferase PR-Set7 [Nilaparvata lugens]|uniref:histone-lysine N-methyltransferase PR-Set7 n=1 Tax=Nilaparvata lugens TaxID=108931 RepID=UPI00193C9CA2|nr:histone-lysine N-methyltransferase PR-Set7 [Nilaparvata lugens]